MKCPKCFLAILCCLIMIPFPAPAEEESYLTCEVRIVVVLSLDVFGIEIKNCEEVNEMGNLNYPDPKDRLSGTEYLKLENLSIPAMSDRDVAWVVNKLRDCLYNKNATAKIRIAKGVHGNYTERTVVPFLWEGTREADVLLGDLIVDGKRVEDIILELSSPT